MNKYFLVLIIIIAGLTACQKESNTTSPTTGSTQNLEQLILNFGQKLESGQKDGTTYAIDSAVWYVEALLNYNLGSVGIKCSGITVDTVETNLLTPATGEYTLSQLETVYNSLLNQVQQNQPEGTIMFAADVYHHQTETVMVFAVCAAYATPVGPLYKALNDTSGCWYWGGDLGMCGPDSGLYVGMDASDVLENRISNTTSDVWSSLETISILPTWYVDPNFPFDITYLQPTRMFYAEGPWLELYYYCIPSNVMDYYLSSNGIWYIINDIKPTGKVFAYCDINPVWFDSNSIGHYSGFTFGIPVH